MQPLLALIDFQSAFLSAPGIEPAVEGVVQRASTLLRACRELQIPVVHVRTATPQGSDIPRLKSGAGTKPQIGSPGYECPAALIEQTGEPVIHKIGYSGLRETEFDNLVQQFNVDTLLIAGVYLHACVRQTVLDARVAGWQVWVAEDAVASDDPLHAAITRRFLEARSVRFAKVASLLQVLASPGRLSEQPRLATVDTVVSRAAQFAPAWRNSESRERIDLVRTLIDRLDHSEKILTERITFELGKPIRFSEAEVQRTREMLSAIIRHCETGQVIMESAVAVVRRCPLGTIAVITPFNNPIYLALGKIVPAILYGNTVVWKPAPEAIGVCAK